MWSGTKVMLQTKCRTRLCRTRVMWDKSDQKCTWCSTNVFLRQKWHRTKFYVEHKWYNRSEAGYTICWKKWCGTNVIWDNSDGNTWDVGQKLYGTKNEKYVYVISDQRNVGQKYRSDVGQIWCQWENVIWDKSAATPKIQAKAWCGTKVIRKLHDTVQMPLGPKWHRTKVM